MKALAPAEPEWAEVPTQVPPRAPCPSGHSCRSGALPFILKKCGTFFSPQFYFKRKLYVNNASEKPLPLLINSRKTSTAQPRRWILHWQMWETCAAATPASWWLREALGLSGIKAAAKRALTVPMGEGESVPAREDSVFLIFRLFLNITVWGASLVHGWIDIMTVFILLLSVISWREFSVIHQSVE